jgi:hypothetical protein
MNRISKPLLAGLLASTVLSLLLLLQTETTAMGAADDELLAERQPQAQAKVQAKAFAENAPWQREHRPLPRARLDQGFAPPPPPAAKPVVVVAPPPKPVAPQPGFNYLGRMLREGKTYLFLGYDDEVEVVAVGDTIGGSWRIESVNDTGVELNYLPLNETRRLAMSER